MIDDAQRSSQTESTDRTELLRAAACAARGTDPPGAEECLGPGAGERGRAETDRLVEFARQRGIPVTQFDWQIDELPVQGNEHAVDLSLRDGRVHKFTTKNRHAGSMFLLDDQNRPVRLRHAFASEYLERLALQNEFFGDDIGLEGISLDGRLHTSQPYREGTHPEPDEISTHLKREGFRTQIAPGGDPYYLHPDGILVADEKPENWMKDADGRIVPIDLILVDLRSI